MPERWEELAALLLRLEALENEAETLRNSPETAPKPAFSKLFAHKLVPWHGPHHLWPRAFGPAAYSAPAALQGAAGAGRQAARHAAAAAVGLWLQWPGGERCAVDLRDSIRLLPGGALCGGDAGTQEAADLRGPQPKAPRLERARRASKTHEGMPFCMPFCRGFRWFSGRFSSLSCRFRVTCLSYCPSQQLCASGQSDPKGGAGPFICIWRPADCILLSCLVFRMHEDTKQLALGSVLMFFLMISYDF